MKKKHQLQIRARLLYDEEIALGPGKVDLLQAIMETGSISAAARHMGMSYRRAWLLVDTMNRCFKTPLVTSSAGGSHGGGAQLTEMGVEILQRYRKLMEALEETAKVHVSALEKELKR